MSVGWPAHINSQRLLSQQSQHTPFLPHQCPKPSPVLSAPTHEGVHSLISGVDKYRGDASPKVVANRSTDRGLDVVYLYSCLVFFFSELLMMLNACVVYGFSFF